MFLYAVYVTDVGNPIELGCLRDSGLRALYEVWVHSAAMTNEMCHEICKLEVM